MGDSFGSKHSALPSYLLKSKDSDFPVRFPVDLCVFGICYLDMKRLLKTRNGG
jgi:hypothetical protein